jgi:hypothetical protein
VSYSETQFRVLFHPEAGAELSRLPVAERAAVRAALEKLEALGPRLPFPHQSAVKGASGLRELRPRAGRSRWRALYRRTGQVMLVLTIGPDAKVDQREFRSSVLRAAERFAEIDVGRKRKGKR